MKPPRFYDFDPTDRWQRIVDLSLRIDQIHQEIWDLVDRQEAAADRLAALEREFRALIGEKGIP